MLSFDKLDLKVRFKLCFKENRIELLSGFFKCGCPLLFNNNISISFMIIFPFNHITMTLVSTRDYGLCTTCSMSRAHIYITPVLGLIFITLFTEPLTTIIMISKYQIKDV